MEKNCEDIKPKNMEKENRIWKAAKIGVLALGLIAFGKDLKTEEPMKSPFIKEHGETGLSIEYNYNIGDDNESNSYDANTYRSKYDFTVTDYDYTVHAKANIWERTFLKVIVGRNVNENKSDYKDKYLGSNGWESTNQFFISEQNLDNVEISVGSFIAPDGVNKRWTWSIGYAQEITNKYNNFMYRYEEPINNLYLGSENGNPITITGDRITNVNENYIINRLYRGWIFSLQHIGKIGSTYITPNFSVKGLNGDLTYEDVWALNIDINGNVCYMGSCSPGRFSDGLTITRNGKIKTNISEIKLGLPFSIGKNLAVIEWIRRQTKYNESSIYVDNEAKRIIINAIILTYKRALMKDLNAVIGYRHETVENKKETESYKKENGRFKAGLEIKF